MLCNRFYLYKSRISGNLSTTNEALLYIRMVYPSEKKKWQKKLYQFYGKWGSLWSVVDSKTQGLRPRPRTQKKSEAKDSPSEDRPSRSQAHECSRPRTKGTSVLEKKRSSKKFLGGLKTKVFKIIFQAIYKNLTIQKIVLSSNRELGNFRGLEASRPRPRTSKCVLKDSTSVNDINRYTVY